MSAPKKAQAGGELAVSCGCGLDDRAGQGRKALAVDPDAKTRNLKRLRRIEGQVRGLHKMIEEDRYCADIMTQISAAQAALDKVALGLLDDHVHHCVVGGPETKQDERTEELMAAVGRLMRRG